jgi:DNA-binding MarR family transcriptional regulator
MIYDEALRPTGLRITQLSILRGLGRLGEATVTQLAAEAALDRTTMSRNIKLLVDAGWIDVLPAAADRREKILRLNSLGRGIGEKAMPDWARAQKRIEAYIRRFLKSPTRDQLLQVLETIQQAATRDHE